MVVLSLSDGQEGGRLVFEEDEIIEAIHLGGLATNYQDEQFEVVEGTSGLGDNDYTGKKWLII